MNSDGICKLGGVKDRPFFLVVWTLRNASNLESSLSSLLDLDESKNWVKEPIHKSVHQMIPFTWSSKIGKWLRSKVIENRLVVTGGRSMDWKTARKPLWGYEVFHLYWGGGSICHKT